LDKTLAVYGSLFQKWDGEANWFIFWLEISIFSLFLLDISRCEEHRKLETVKVKGWDEAGDPIGVGFMVDRTSYELDYELAKKNQEAPLAGHLLYFINPLRMRNIWIILASPSHWYNPYLYWKYMDNLDVHDDILSTELRHGLKIMENPQISSV
jgi:hypothetical protein